MKDATMYFMSGCPRPSLLFRYPQNKRNNGRRNGNHAVADGTPESEK
jgi:hypothetical protein